MKNKLSWVVLIIWGCLISCQPAKKAGSSDSDIHSAKKILQDNVLSTTERDAGWTLLFDGASISDHWHKYNTDSLNRNWVIDDNTIHFNPDHGDGGDLTSNRSYEDFELKLDWRIQDCGNSGIMYNVQEGADYDHPWLTGPEMQILDATCHPDGKIDKHRAGDLYDLIECGTVTVKPAGEWNSIKIISNEGDYEFWQNDVKVVSFTMHTAEWDAMVAGSKFVEMPDFGKFTSGKIVLQDHTDRVWFKNIKIKNL
jgi:cytochrome c